MNPQRFTALTLSCFWLLLLLTLSDCKNSVGDIDSPQPDSLISERPGQIAGMGETPGPLGGKPFILPKGISLVGPIQGRDDGRHQDDCTFDGSGFNVTVTMTLQRDSTGSPTTVEFPSGLVIVTASEGFQHGLLIERVVVTVPPKEPGPGSIDMGRCQVTLMLSCLNSARKPADATARYKLGPVTNSPLIQDFIKRLSTKKIMYSAFGEENDEDWFENQERIQEALWNLTDGKGLTATDLVRIRNLPNK